MKANPPPWANDPIPEAEAVALVAWIDNEVERMRRVRDWIARTYMPQTVVYLHPQTPPTFTMNDALRNLLEARRAQDKRVLDLLRRVAIAVENKHKERAK